MRLVVAGGGLSGLATCLSLHRYARRVLAINEIILLDGQLDINHARPIGIGLWENSFLCLQKLMPESKPLRGRWSCAAGYRRARDGHWLSFAPSNNWRIFLADRRDICKVLHQACLDIGVKILPNTTVAGYSLNPVSKEVHVNIDSGFNQISNPSLIVHAKGIEITNKDPVIGITVSGITEMPPLQSLHPFETLGTNGRRFAVVPLNDTTVYWFATMRAHDRDVVLESKSGGNPFEALCKIFAEFHDPIGEILKQSEAARTDLVFDDMYDGYRRWKYKRGAFGVGDCTAYMGHNLAQGASMGIEQATLLGQCMAKQRLNSFYRLAKRRYKRCRRVTRFTEFLAMNPQCADLLGFIPQPINGYVFDRFLDYSLDSTHTKRLLKL